MRFFPHFGNIEIFAITLPCGVAAWLSFIDPIWQAYSTFGWTSVAGIALSVLRQPDRRGMCHLHGLQIG